MSLTTAPSGKVQQNKPAATTRSRSIALTAIDCLASGAFVLVGLEILFASAGVGQEEFLQYDSRFGCAPMPGKQITFRSEGFSRTTFNSFGMRDREISLAKPAGTIRVAMLGDSLTAAVQVDRSKTSAALLEEKLNSEFSNSNYEVLNFGVDSYSLPQKYLRLKHLALDFKPDLVLMELRIAESVDLMPGPLGGLSTARPFFLVDGHDQLVEVRSYQQQWLQSKTGKRMRATAWLRRHSALWGVIGSCVQRLGAQWKRIGAQIKGAPDKRKTEKVSSRKVVKYTFVPLNPYLRRLTRVLLLQAKRDCEKQGCHLAIYYLTGLNTLRHDEEEVFLTETAKELGIPFLNFRKPIEDYKGQEPLVVSHFSLRGHRLIADELFPFVKKNFSALWKTDASKVSDARERHENAL